ncbi:mevalonate kinase-like isoform X2 [Hydractinia symbiolongicarpus]|uniref:mevalonate kinase-like isoform X2 n=1 Tax=Hydractinia symbiolongicarpus TaxID=13093 RepID=UPI002551338D|nr:mevalonate kinase-like isoform X2 [Hydractinia symbiolongicarpus]
MGPALQGLLFWNKKGNKPRCIAYLVSSTLLFNVYSSFKYIASFTYDIDVSKMLQKVTTSAPGKIILCGEHAVVYGKEAIACSLNLRTTCCIELLSNSQFEINVPGLDLQKCWNITEIYQLYDTAKIDPTHPEIHKENEAFVKLLENEEKNLQKLSLHIILMLYICIGSSFKDKTGLRITLTSQLPIGGGLGSSASFAVAVSSALLVLYGVISSKQDEWSDSHYKLISDWSYQAETIIHGTPSGIDNSVATYGHCVGFKAGHVDLLTNLSFMKLDVLVVNTKIPRSTRELVGAVREKREKFPELFESIFNSIDCITRSFKEILLEISRGSNNARIYKNLKDLISINGHLLEGIGVGHECISSVVTTCSKYGLGSKLTGAGGGGCVFALIPPGYCKEKIDKVVKELESQNFECWRTVLGGGGVQLHTVT